MKTEQINDLLNAEIKTLARRSALGGDHWMDPQQKRKESVTSYFTDPSKILKNLTN